MKSECGVQGHKGFLAKRAFRAVGALGALRAFRAIGALGAFRAIGASGAVPDKLSKVTELGYTVYPLLVLLIIAVSRQEGI